MGPHCSPISWENQEPNKVLLHRPFEAEGGERELKLDDGLNAATCSVRGAAREALEHDQLAALPVQALSRHPQNAIQAFHESAGQGRAGVLENH